MAEESLRSIRGQKSFDFRWRGILPLHDYEDVCTYHIFHREIHLEGALIFGAVCWNEWGGEFGDDFLMRLRSSVPASEPQGLCA